MLLSAYKNTNDFNISLKCFFTQSDIFLCVYGSPEGQITFFFLFFSGDPFSKNLFLLGLVFTRFQTSKTKTSQEFYMKNILFF